MNYPKKQNFDYSIAIFDLLYDQLNYPHEAVHVARKGDADWTPLLAILDEESSHPIAYIRTDPFSSKRSLKEEARKYKEFCDRCNISNIPLYLFVPDQDRVRIFGLKSNFKWVDISNSTFPTYESLVELAREIRRSSLEKQASVNSFAWSPVIKWGAGIVGSLISAALVWFFGWK